VVKVTVLCNFWNFSMGKFRQFFKHWLTHIVFTAGLDQIRDFAAQKPKQREKERDIEKTIKK